jgi:hypothetical protein
VPYFGDEFGNYLAGYSGQLLAGDAGYWAARAGGVVYDLEPLSDFNFDLDSVDDIDAGADAAQSESGE